MHFKLIASSLLAFAAAHVAAGVKFAGVNIAGFDFGTDIWGNCTLAWVTPPLPGYGGDGPGQMKHFVNDDKLNIFRLPVSWQYLLNGTLGGTLNAANTAKYDQLMQACISTGAYCVIDIHNYARWNGGIIGEGGPDPKYFANLWSQLASKYRSQSRVMMGLMNEPHDLANVNNWAKGAVQSAVNAIRAAGARTQYILLPGNGWTGVGSFVSGGSAAALAAVTDPSGGTSRLIFDVHTYYDVDGSGTHTNCVTNKISDGFQPLATWLRQNKRQAILSETGGGPTDSTCLSNVCQALDFMNANSDVYLGWIGWAAGSFSSAYELILAPQGGKDVPLMTQCFSGKFKKTTARSIDDNVVEIASRYDVDAAFDSEVSNSPEEKRSDVLVPSRRRRRRLDGMLVEKTVE